MAKQQAANPKSCVFCGNAPDNKTREHVIPRWLIEFTGDPKRIWQFGEWYGEEDASKRERRFAADQFQFPACEACNSAYSDLEGRAKSYVTKLVASEPLTAREWDDLLDWFDKVRIGLWLGMRALSQELELMPARFHIDQRIGRKDRCVLVYRLNSDHEGLTLTGAGDPLFLFWPSCLALTINGLIFMNISIEFLLAARIGFPFPRKIQEVEEGISLSDFDAFYHTKIPLIRFSFPPAPIEVYQAISMRPDEMAGDGAGDYLALLDNPFVRDRLLPGSDTRSLVYASNGSTVVAHAPDDLIRERDLPQAAYRHGATYIIRYLEYREHMVRTYLASGRAERSETALKAALKVNRGAIQELEDKLERHLRELATAR